MADLPLYTAELTMMRHTVEQYLAGTAVIHTRTTASDSQGGYVQTYAAASTVDARLSPLSGDEVQLAERIGEVNLNVLTIPYETSIAETSRVVYDGVTYEIKHVADRTPWELSRRVLVIEVD